MANSEVRRERAYLTYALLRGIRVDVGQLIYREMTESMTSSRSHMSLGFPALIYSLAQAAGVIITPNPSTCISLQKVITLQLFQTGGQPREQAQRPHHSPEPLDIDDDADDDEERDASSEGSSRSHRTLGQRIDVLTQRFDALDTRVNARLDASDARMTEMQIQMSSGFDMMQQYFADFAARFPPPPTRN